MSSAVDQDGRENDVEDADDKEEVGGDEGH